MASPTDAKEKGLDEIVAEEQLRLFFKKMFEAVDIDNNQKLDKEWIKLFLNRVSDRNGEAILKAKLPDGEAVLKPK